MVDFQNLTKVLCALNGRNNILFFLATQSGLKPNHTGNPWKKFSCSRFGQGLSMTGNPIAL